MPDKEKREWIEVGVAWKKDGAKGLMFSIEPDKLNDFVSRAETNDKGRLALFMYRNEDKQNDRAPDYRLVGPVPMGSDALKDKVSGHKNKDDDDDLPF
jgi:hypothetical protein